MRNWRISNLSMALISAVCLFFVSCGPKPEPPEPPEPPKPVKVTGVSVSPATHELEIDRRYMLRSTVTPSDAANQLVTWTSDKPSVATVNAKTGEVIAIARSEATITATTVDGG